MTEAVYIHIPFCEKICSYCDFCKVLYNEKLVDKYLDSLESEIKKRYLGEKIKTLYIGGGTPSSLNITQLTRLFEITNIFVIHTWEFCSKPLNRGLVVSTVERWARPYSRESAFSTLPPRVCEMNCAP